MSSIIFTDHLRYFSAFQEVGGYEALQYRYMQAVPKLTYENTSCGLPRDDSWIMLRHPVNSDLPWPAFLLGQTPASIWYWCADQVCLLIKYNYCKSISCVLANHEIMFIHVKVTGLHEELTDQEIEQ